MLYYFLLTALPPFSLKTRPEMTFKELKDFLSLNLSPRDFKKVVALLRWIDLYNIRAFWLGLPLDNRGNLEAKELEEALLVRDVLPAYLVEYLDRYETIQERLNFFSAIYAEFFREAQGKLNGFLERYFRFEREQMLILTALRAKRMGRNIAKEMQFEDLADPLVSYILAQKDAEDFLPPKEFEDLKNLFVEKGDDPEKLNRELLEYRLKKIEEMEEEEAPYSVGRVLGYVARFLVIDSWFQLDRDKGRQIIDNLSQYG